MNRRLKGHYESNPEGRSTQAGRSEWRIRGLDGDLGVANGRGVEGVAGGGK